MELQDYLEKEAGRIESYLARYFDEQQFDRRFPRYLLDAMRYSLEAGGKRLRPVLTQTVFSLITGSVEPVLPLAAALEMIHTYSLIHDDLPAMDDDDLRRGKPTCHIKYGEPAAILAGDALLTEAFAVLSRIGIKPVLIPQLVQGLAEAAGMHGMVGGQAADLHAEVEPPDKDGLDYIHLNKTAALLRAAVRLPAIAAGVAPEEAALFDEYGKWLGIAFQAADDILDVAGDQQLLGKPVGSDMKQGKVTYVTLYGIDKAKELSRQFVNSACAALEKLKYDTSILRSLAYYTVDRQK